MLPRAVGEGPETDSFVLGEKTERKKKTLQFEKNNCHVKEGIRSLSTTEEPQEFSLGHRDGRVAGLHFTSTFFPVYLFLRSREYKQSRGRKRGTEDSGKAVH